MMMMMMANGKMMTLISQRADAGLLCAGFGDAVSTQKEAKTAAPGRRQKATSGDKGAQKAKKARVAPKGK